MFPNTYNPFSGPGYGAAQWTDYALPPQWVGTAGYGQEPGAAGAREYYDRRAVLWGGAAVLGVALGAGLFRRQLPKPLRTPWIGFGVAGASAALFVKNRRERLGFEQLLALEAMKS